MSLFDIDKLWDEVHTFYPAPAKQKKSWLDDYTMTPNGSLIYLNSFHHSTASNPNKVYLLHVTKDLDKILDTKTLFPSAGCLIGSVYVTHLTKEKDVFKMHNLGQHILHQEAVLTSKKPVPLIIEMTFDTVNEPQKMAGLDYLKLGTIHHAIYRNLRYLLTPSERSDLESIVLSRISASLDFITLSQEIYLGHRKVDPKEYIKALNRQITVLPFLGYMYFEALSRYTMLYADDMNSRIYRSKGEFNNEIYKHFLLEVYKEIGAFKLSDFNIPLKVLGKKLDSLQKTYGVTFNKSECFQFIQQHVAMLVVDLFFSKNMQHTNIHSLEQTYKNYEKYLAPLIGHVIHRELRNFDRYADFYFYFDQFKALSVWNYWNRMNIALPYNGPLHKGEIGINPAYPHAKIKIYEAISNPFADNELVIKRELKNVHMASRLVELKHTAMRSKDHIKTKNVKGAKNEVRG